MNLQGRKDAMDALGTREEEEEFLHVSSLPPLRVRLLAASLCPPTRLAPLATSSSSQIFFFLQQSPSLAPSCMQRADMGLNGTPLAPRVSQCVGTSSTYDDVPCTPLPSETTISNPPPLQQQDSLLQKKEKKITTPAFKAFRSLLFDQMDKGGGAHLKGLSRLETFQQWMTAIDPPRQSLVSPLLPQKKKKS